MDMSQNIQSVKINSDAFDINADHHQKKDLNHFNQILESHLMNNIAQNHHSNSCGKIHEAPKENLQNI